MSCAFTSYPIFRHSPPLAFIHDLPGELEMKEDMEIPVLDKCNVSFMYFSPFTTLFFSWQYEASQPLATFLVILIIEFGKFCLKPMRHVII